MLSGQRGGTQFYISGARVPQWKETLVGAKLSRLVRVKNTEIYTTESPFQHTSTNVGLRGLDYRH